ncbi:hypothetical protein [Nocardia huaxiensis]|uniref:Mce-associated membrane protein n=1 Tax=Nocardia huaxiensis TaxID=2755382 RepID=A0A7D6VEF3_9NOCA|nr:hypothetical protein [Nocardia huaxiensis]QLY30575.1 hypothetical protein H0264_36625 [Nocardia huaxiensis]UFS95822.1 hypothetical protein LPY97_35050 [Nocardia huaxiensis]
MRSATAVRGAVLTALMVLLCVVAGFAGVARADTAKAEKVATDYAVGAATVDYRDTDSWMTRLKTNATPELAAKYDGTRAKLEQILVPLKWESTAVPVSAKTNSEKDDVYQVVVVLDVTTRNTQSPEWTHSMVTYYITVDGRRGYQVSDAGGDAGPLN